MDIVITQEQKGPECLLSLKGEMSIYSAAELKTALLAQLHSCHSLSLDLTGVSEMDTAGLQILLLCKQEAQAAGKAFNVQGISTAAMEAVALLRLEKHFELQTV